MLMNDLNLSEIQFDGTSANDSFEDNFYTDMGSTNGASEIDITSMENIIL